MKRSLGRIRRSSFAFIFSAVALAWAPPAGADLEHTQVPFTSGHGIGAVNTVLTIQNTGNESGCVAWNGSADVIGSSACPTGLATPIAGGNEKTGSSQTQTRSLLELGIGSAQSIRVIFNGSQTGNGGITITNLVLTVYKASDGTVLWDSGDLAGRPIVFTETGGGIGSTGDVFDLTAAQITSLNSSGALADPDNRVGIAMSCSGANNGGETVYVASGCPAITLSPADLPAGTFGSVYGPVTITASGGSAPYTFALVDSTLPTGMTFTNNGGNPGSATLGGTPTQSGSFPVTILATDSNGCEGVHVDTIVINPVTCAGVTISISPPTGALPDAVEQVSYSQQFIAGGGASPYTFLLSAGSLPPQLTLSGSGFLSGVPDTNTFGTYHFSVQATDNDGCSGEEDYVLTVLQAGSPVAVPTLTQWGLLALGLGLAAVALIFLRQGS